MLQTQQASQAEHLINHQHRHDGVALDALKVTVADGDPCRFPTCFYTLRCGLPKSGCIEVTAFG
jgi:hypothetical protein